VSPHDADLILKLIEDGKTASFQFGELDITIRDEASDGYSEERLKLWGGLTIKQGVNYGRIMNVSVHETTRANDKSS
jgi:hypothetical protein